ncbi:hypothetical protein E8E15_009243 [Penicillium rubens]|jgi:hypothetical protein|uniref:Pc16g09740 protein n=2 Tax=Penicillium chrysogenum species complex TaxID=254878 RepID=B6H8V7_PENRW|nr:uncharacterized protein N7525_010776 [Penicillium rubens]KAF3028546.1 hypothetical protein E8E15_009243 [Penicillium rubens]KAJ5821492.1 hypothetical protein N7525_010776 [Penicillium rubens]KZN93775.1 Aflatoxin biosynthesis regulatory protein [Penicillium chrysogenum]CAP93644.1 Pc16g09740 [Penicillium rubens Wisconsin 54-1255]
MNRSRIQSSRSSKTSLPNTSSSLQTPKLKDSCDKCSASKLRCTKEKPFCTRCDKLGYTCFYSPARRAGRPYRSRNQLPEDRDSEESNRPSASHITTTHFVDESARLYSRFNGSSIPIGATSNISNSDSTPCNNKTAKPDPNIAKDYDSSDPDCMLVALDIFSELEVPAEQLRRASPVDASLLRTTAQTITAAFHRLSTILTCPCSERAEVGMLISAICMSIIDMHAVTISTFAKDQPPTGLPSQQTPCESSSAGSHRSPEHEAIAMQAFTELSELARLIVQLTERYDEGNGALNRNGLGKVSELPTDTLPGMATCLRERFQQIANDATHWFG